LLIRRYPQTKLLDMVRRGGVQRNESWVRRRELQWAALFLKFEQLINSHNAEAVCALCTADSIFIDSLGNRVAGTQKLRAAREGYFKMVPDYTISHSQVFAEGETVAMFGSAQGTFAKDGQLKREDFWKTSAAWRGVVKDGKIAVWQVFADNEPIRTVMRKYK
jgi:ketosteroid isomerase-like protein